MCGATVQNLVTRDLYTPELAAVALVPDGRPIWRGRFQQNKPKALLSGIAQHIQMRKRCQMLWRHVC
jgi:hypothetical protein